MNVLIKSGFLCLGFIIFLVVRYDVNRIIFLKFGLYDVFVLVFLVDFCRLKDEMKIWSLLFSIFFC